MLEMSEFKNRRKKLMQKIGEDGICILSAAPVAFRNADCEYAYRQNSDFYYLTGFQEPFSVMVLAPKHPKGPFIIFNRKKNRDEEIWNGYQSGQAGAIKNYHADSAFPIEEFETQLPSLLAGRKTLHYASQINRAFDHIIDKGIKKISGKIRSGYIPSIKLMDLTDSLHELRLIKSKAEIDLMKKASHFSVKGHLQAIEKCKPGMFEYELAAELHYEFQKHGAHSLAYSSIVGSGPNSCILHYNENNKKILNGSMVLIDAGCEFQNYASDITRSFPANGKFSAEQKAIYEIVLEAQLAGIKLIKPGLKWSAIQDAIIKIITQGLINLKLLKGKLDTLIKNKAYAKFYMHNSGHWLGLDVHDVGKYKIDDQWRKLKPGMVLTVEPGIYISADSDVPKRWHNIGVRIEDDVVVTKNGHEVITQTLPKTISDIEGLMR